MTQLLQPIRERDFNKGMNDKTKPEDLKSGYCADAKDVIIDDNKIVKRSGYTTISNAPVSKAILGQADFRLANGTNYIIRARNNAGDTNAVVESWSGAGNWTALTDASSQTVSLEHEFVMANNVTYIFNATDIVLKTTNATSTSTVAAIHIGQGAKWFHNYLFVFGVTTNPNRLYFSDVNTPETFDAVNGFIDINTDDGDIIIGLAVLKDELLIFKRNRVWSLTGYGTDDFSLAENAITGKSDLSERMTGYGTLARRSIVEIGNDVYYFSFRGDVPHFRSIQRTKFGELVDAGLISDAITGTMDGLVKTRLNQCCGIFDGRRVYWSVTATGTTNNRTLVYDTLEKSWVRWSNVNANVFHLSLIGNQQQIFFGSADANGKSYRFDGATNDDGTAIAMLYDTRAYNPVPEAKCRYKYIYLTADVESDVDLDVDYSPDGFSFSDLGTISLTGSGAAFGTAIFGTSKFGSTTVARDRLDAAGGTAYYMQYRFQNSVLDEEISIREFEILYKPRGLRAA